VKNLGSRVVYLHRLIRGAGLGEQVKALDDDLLNFCKISFALYSSFGTLEESGPAWNLYLVHDTGRNPAAKSRQQAFEARMKQFHVAETEDGSLESEPGG